MSQPKKKLSQTDLIPFSEGETIALIALDRIDTKAQVRTTFDEDSLAELASDIKTRGIMQPITVRQVEEGRFLIVAGERRYRAAAIAGLTAVPALVRNATDAEAEDMQLAENIQREELSLMDTAAGIRKLFNREKNLGKVAALVNKSKPWVCKHLALTMEDMSQHAKALMRDGATEDMEILNLVSKVDRDFGSYEAFEMAKQIRAGEMNRTKARQYAKDLKDDAEHDKELQENIRNEAEEEEEGEPEFYTWKARHQIAASIQEAKEAGQEPNIEEIAGTFTDDQKRAIEQEAVEDYMKGREVAKLEGKARLWAIMKYCSQGNQYWHDAAFTIGYLGEALNLKNLIEQMQTIEEETSPD